MEETLAWKRIEQIVKQRNTKQIKASNIVNSVTKLMDKKKVNKEKSSFNNYDTRHAIEKANSDVSVVCRKFNMKTSSYSGCGGVGHIFRFCPHNQCRMCYTYGHIHIDCPYAPDPQINLWEEFDPTSLCFVSGN